MFAGRVCARDFRGVCPAGAGSTIAGLPAARPRPLGPLLQVLPCTEPLPSPSPWPSPGSRSLRRCAPTPGRRSRRSCRATCAPGITRFRSSRMPTSSVSTARPRSISKCCDPPIASCCRRWICASRRRACCQPTERPRFRRRRSRSMRRTRRPASFSRRPCRPAVIALSCPTPARSAPRPTACSRSITRRRPATSAPCTPSSRTPMRGASFLPGTSPTTRRHSPSKRSCPRRRWPSATCRLRRASNSATAASACVSPLRRRCPPTCCSSDSAISNAPRSSSAIPRSVS